MYSTAVVVTAIISAIGFLLNGGMLYLVLSRGRKAYHYLFAAILLICAVWDIGILLCMLRNSHESELIIYGYIVVLPCTFLTALIYHFTTTYLQKTRKITTLVLWVFLHGWIPPIGDRAGWKNRWCFPLQLGEYLPARSHPPNWHPRFHACLLVCSHLLLLDALPGIKKRDLPHQKTSHALYGSQLYRPDPGIRKTGGPI